MGLFDFLKPKEKEGLASLVNNPKMRKVVLAMQLEYVEKEVANLKAVGREQDANKRISGFLQECLQEWKQEPQNPAHLTLLANAAVKLGALEAGKESLKIVIQANEENPIIDLTTVYFDLGRIYHQLHGTCEKELWAFHTATQCEPPPKCKFPAKPTDKAKAHSFACSCAKVLRNEEYANYHGEMARRLVPELDWDDTMAVIRWIQTN